MTNECNENFEVKISHFINTVLLIYNVFENESRKLPMSNSSKCMEIKTKIKTVPPILQHKYKLHKIFNKCTNIVARVKVNNSK